MAKKVAKKVEKKAAPKKAAPKKAAPKKAAPKKAAPKKAAPKKAAPKKAVVKKAAPKKVAPKKVAPKKAVKIKAVKTKGEFIKHLQAVITSVELSQKASDEIFKAVFEILAVSVKKNTRFQVPSFGTFSVAKRKARWGRNPQKPEEKIKIKASKTMKFKPSTKIKERL